MGKKETQQSYSDVRGEAQAESDRYVPAREASQQRANEMGATFAAQRADLNRGFFGMMEDPSDISAREVSAQQVAAERIEAARIAAQEKIDFKGIADPRKTNVSELRDTLGQYQKFRDTGGLSEENINRMRGMGYYDEFAKTGGYTPEAIANIKAQAISPIGTYATGTREELARRQAVQGGYGPGFDAANRALQRDTARGIADVSLAANVGIQEKINEGRKWGVTGISDSENKVATLQTANKLNALAGEQGIAAALSQLDQNDIRLLQEAGMFNAQGEFDEAKFNASMKFETERANQQATNDIAKSNQDAMLRAAMANQSASLSADIYNSQAGMSAAQYNQQNQQNQFARGMEGLGGLYGADISLQQNEYDRQLAIQAQEDRARAEYQRTQAGLATQGGKSSWFGSAMGGIGGVLGPLSQTKWFKGIGGGGGSGGTDQYGNPVGGGGSGTNNPEGSGGKTPGTPEPGPVDPSSLYEGDNSGIGGMYDYENNPYYDPNNEYKFQY